MGEQEKDVLYYAKTGSGEYSPLGEIRSATLTEADMQKAEDATDPFITNWNAAAEPLALTISEQSDAWQSIYNGFVEAFKKAAEFLEAFLYFEVRRKNSADFRRRASAARYRRRKAEKRRAKAEWKERGAL